MLQINLGVDRAAHDLILASASLWEVDVLIISEQNRNRSETEGWFSDSSGRAAVAVLSNIPVNSVSPLENGFRWIEVTGFRIYSCYCTPNCSITEFKDFLIKLESSLRNSPVPTVNGGDLNASLGHGGVQ